MDMKPYRVFILSVLLSSVLTSCENKVSKDKYDRLMKENERLEQQLNHYEEYCGQLQIQLDSCQNRLDSAREQLDAANSEIASRRFEIINWIFLRSFVCIDTKEEGGACPCFEESIPLCWSSVFKKGKVVITTTNLHC